MKITRKTALVSLLLVPMFGLAGCARKEEDNRTDLQKQEDAEKSKKADQQNRDRLNAADPNYRIQRAGERANERNAERQNSNTSFRTPASYVGETEFGNGIDRSELTLD